MVRSFFLKLHLNFQNELNLATPSKNLTLHINIFFNFFLFAYIEFDTKIPYGKFREIIKYTK